MSVRAEIMEEIIADSAELLDAPAEWVEPELTCPHIDRAIASGELSESVKDELLAVREINSQLRYGTWALKARLSTAHREGFEEGMMRAAEIVRSRIPHMPPDGPINTEHLAEYEALGFAMQDILAELTNKEPAND